jgi:hypothetical protein
VGVNYRVSKDSVVSFTVDVFNLFNFQTADRVDQSYTFAEVLPIYDPVTKTPGTQDDLAGGVPLAGTDPVEYLSDEQLNKNFKNPDRYQAPRQIRFGVRYTF